MKHIYRQRCLPLTDFETSCIRYGEINRTKKHLKNGHPFDYSTAKAYSGTNFNFYQYLTATSDKHSKRQRLKMYYLLMHYGLNIKKPWREFYLPVDSQNNVIYKIWNDLFKNKCFNICIALQTLELPALQTMEICKATHPYSVIIPFHFFWQLVTKIKHFKN